MPPDGVPMANHILRVGQHGRVGVMARVVSVEVSVRTEDGQVVSALEPVVSTVEYAVAVAAMECRLQVGDF